MSEQKNYIDERGNYHNVENLTLTQIHDRASEEGYRLAKETMSEELALQYTKGYQAGFLEAKVLYNEPQTKRVCQTPSIYHNPIENKYKKTVDCGAEMLECPQCAGRITLNAFTYAVGDLGYAFCPYCGADMRKKEGQLHE